MSRRSWHRLVLSLIGIALTWATWRMAIDELARVKPEAIASFTTITVNALYVIASIIIFMISGRMIYEWKVNTASSIIESGTQIAQEFTDKTPAPKHFDDGSIQ